MSLYMRISSLDDDVIYTYQEFRQVLEAHNIPNSAPYIRKMEKIGLFRSPRLPSAENTKSAKRYTGRMIKEMVEGYLRAVETRKIPS